MPKTSDGRAMLVLVCVIVLGSGLYLALNPMARVELFRPFGRAEWAYRHLTSLQEKCDIFNKARYYVGNKPYGRTWSIGGGSKLFHSGREWLWMTSGEPFVLQVTFGNRPEEGETIELKRIDADTLVYYSQDFPIKITFTREELHPEHRGNRELVRFYALAEPGPR